MSSLPAEHEGSGLRVDPRHYGTPNTRTDHNLTNNIQGDSNTNVGNVSNSYNTINVGVDEDSSRIQAWLSQLEPERRHRDVSDRRLDGVGDWVLQSNEFESWRDSKGGSPDPILLCYGGQGVGKTFISSLVIDSLRDETCGENAAVLSLYCDYQIQKDQSAVNMIGSLLSQVALGARQIPSEIQRTFELKQGGRQALRLPDMLKLFVKTVSSTERVYICFDAVDELLPQNRTELLRSLQQIIQDAPNIRLFLTGRPHIRGEIDKYLTNRADIIHIVADQGDIARYINRKMEDDDARDPDLMPDDLKNDILKTMLDKASEMFLLVALNIDAILGETSIAKRKKMLRKVATTGVDLESVYAQTLQRIREQKGDRSRLGMEVLMWICHAERPLTIDELRHALAVEIGSTDLDPENIRPQDTVLRSCLGLIVIDKEGLTVRLIHYTLQEYLRLPNILSTAHNTLALTCLTYLNYEQVKRLPAARVLNLQSMPFLEYSSLYWGIHSKQIVSHNVKSLAVELLSQFDNHISATLLFNQIQPYGHHFEAVYSFTGLHCASYFGIAEVVEVLIETRGCDINLQDCGGFTPLMWAAYKENEGVVRLLLARDHVNCDKPDFELRTPLCWASIRGHHGMAELLLASSNVNPNYADIHGRTPLALASANGSEKIVRLLLARDDVNPDEPGKHGETPLSLASRYGYEEVVRLLLARGDVNPDRLRDDGETPLTLACANEHEGVVRLLLARHNFDPDQPEKLNQRPLWWACFAGDEGIVGQLLARDNVNPDEPDSNGRTPLWWASLRGHEGVVRLLLARGGVNPNTPGIEGRTPLSQASMHGHEGVVRLLLGRDDVNSNKPDNSGRTPLWLSSVRRHQGVVRLLLTRDDVNPNKQDKWGRTPLCAATYQGHDEGVRALLMTDGINPHRLTNDDLSPLSEASMIGYEGVVKLLLARDNVDADRSDDRGRTPLCWASLYGHEGVVRQLLARGDVNPDRPDNDRITPLGLASGRGNEGVVRQLLARGDVNPNMPNYQGMTPFWRASFCGNEGVVRQLLARDDVNPSTPDNQGNSPLHMAYIGGHWKIVALVQQRTAAISSPE